MFLYADPHNTGKKSPLHTAIRNTRLISSIEGSLQSCAIITEEYDGALCSTGFYVLSPRIINSETSLVLFKSSAIQALLKRACTGTILTAMNKDEFMAINLPVINKDIQNKIADIIRQSTILRMKANDY